MSKGCKRVELKRGELRKKRESKYTNNTENKVIRQDEETKVLTRYIRTYIKINNITIIQAHNQHKSTPDENNI